MISWFEAIVLGVVQGLTEFLPISSSGHLRIVPALVGWDDPGAAFTAVVQLGTMAAVLVYFARDLWRIALGLGPVAVPPGAARHARRPHGLVHHPRHRSRSACWASRSRTRSRPARATCGSSAGSLILFGIVLYLADRVRPACARRSERPDACGTG